MPNPFALAPTEQPEQQTGFAFDPSAFIPAAPEERPLWKKAALGFMGGVSPHTVGPALQRAAAKREQQRLGQMAQTYVDQAQALPQATINFSDEAEINQARSGVAFLNAIHGKLQENNIFLPPVSDAFLTKGIDRDTKDFYNTKLQPTPEKLKRFGRLSQSDSVEDVYTVVRELNEYIADGSQDLTGINARREKAGLPPLDPLSGEYKVLYQNALKRLSMMPGGAKYIATAEGRFKDAATLDIEERKLEDKDQEIALKEKTYGLELRKDIRKEQDRNTTLTIERERGARFGQVNSGVQSKIQELNQRFAAGEDRGRLLTEIQALSAEIDKAKAFDLRGASSLSALGISVADDGKAYDALKETVTGLLGVWQEAETAQPMAAADIWLNAGEKQRVSHTAQIEAKQKGLLPEYAKDRANIESDIEERQQKVRDTLNGAYDDQAVAVNQRTETYVNADGEQSQRLVQQARGQKIIQDNAQGMLNNLWAGGAGIPFSEQIAEEMVFERIAPQMMSEHGLRPEIIWTRMDEEHPNYDSWLGGDIPRYPKLVFKDVEAEQRVISTLYSGGLEAARMADTMQREFSKRDAGFIARGNPNPIFQSKENFFRFQIQEQMDSGTLDPRLAKYIGGDDPHDVDEILAALEEGEGEMSVTLGEDIDNPVTLDYSVEEGVLLDVIGKLITHQVYQDALLTPGQRRQQRQAQQALATQKTPSPSRSQPTAVQRPSSPSASTAVSRRRQSRRRSSIGE